LQYLLAPILCKSRTQQAQFYTIYQTYLAEDLQIEEYPTTAKTIHIGDTLRIKNTSLVDSEVPVIYEWAYLDKKISRTELQQNNLDFKFAIPPTEQNYLKIIRLVGRDSLTQKILGVDSTVLSIYCH